MAAPCPSPLPPVTTTNDYKPRGEWQKLANLDVYVVGPPAGESDTVPTRAILAVYDVFGVMPQTIQGCDRMAQGVGGWVFLVDFFEGDPLHSDSLPANTEEKQKTVAAWRARRGNHDAATTKIHAVMAAVKEQKEEWKSLSWGTYGLCWGGKLVALNSAKNTPFKASGTAHPGMIATADAKALTIPFICLFSQSDGTPEAEQEYGNAIKAAGEGNVVDKYENMVHGWMAGRSNLQDQEVVREFDRGYSQLAEFFRKHV